MDIGEATGFAVEGEERVDGLVKDGDSAADGRWLVVGASEELATAAITEAAALQLPPGSSRQIVLETYRQLDWLSHYDLLGVSRKAPQSEIDQAYRAHALLFDPARKAHPELADLWKQLTVLDRWLKVAHGVLSDPVKRAAYDKKIDETRPPSQGEATP